MLWGLGPALDLLSEYEKVAALFGLKEINILLIGSTDGRHILKTISTLKRHPVDDTKINFYVMDFAIELVARQLLLLTIALEPDGRLGAQEKSRTWMEIYGNTLLRPVTAKYCISKASQLIHMVTNKEFLNRRLPMVDLQHMKYREIDQMENIFKYWIHNRYSLAKIWDIKLRKSLATRYDAKHGIFDWDYNLKLLKIEDGQRVCCSEYKMWRNTGIAFTWLETDYSVGNPTLAVGIGAEGDSLYSLGYMGDMVSGPYFTFGTDSEEKPMLECRNGCGVRRATDITERNLQRLFHELEHGSPPSDLYEATIDMGLVVVKSSSVDVDREVKLDFEPDRTPENYSAISVPNCKVFFLPSNARELFPKNTKYKEFFDIVFVAQNFFNFLNEDIMSMAKPNGCLIIETRKFVIEVHKEIGEFGKGVRSKLKKFGWEEVTKCHFRRNDHAVCKKRKGDYQPQDGLDTDSESEDKDNTTALPNTSEVLTNEGNHENPEEPDSSLQEKEKDADSISATETKDLNDLGCDRLENEILRKGNGVPAVIKEIAGDYLLSETQDGAERTAAKTEMKGIEEYEKLGTNIVDQENLATTLCENLLSGTAIKVEEKLENITSEVENLMDDIKTCSLNKPSESD